MLAGMRSQTWAEWKEYLEVEAMPWQRLELMLAQVCALLYNANRPSDAPYRSLEDFMLPDPSEQAEDESLSEEELLEQHKQQFLLFAAALGATPAE